VNNYISLMYITMLI